MGRGLRTDRPPTKGERTRRRILAGALEVLAAHGVEGTTHRSVAQAAGVSLSTTTYHFESLDDLLVRAFDMSITEWNDPLDTALSAFLSWKANGKLALYSQCDHRS